MSIPLLCSSEMALLRNRGWNSVGRMGEKPTSYTARQYCAACFAFSVSQPHHAAVIYTRAFHCKNLRLCNVADSLPPSPRRAAGSSTAGAARTLGGADAPLTAHSRLRRELGGDGRYTNRASMRGNEKTSGQNVSRLQVLIRFLFGLAQLGGCLAFQSSNSAMI